jgi:hypothetical protein
MTSTQNLADFQIRQSMSQSPKPDRRRRRWVVVLAIVFVAFVWWLWPRADARFVGRWEIYNTSNPGSSLVGVMVMHANGRGQTEFADGTGTEGFFWTVNGDAFQTGALDGPLWQAIFRQFFARLWMKLTGTPDMRGVHELRIDRVTENEISLLSDDGNQIIYRRMLSPDRGDTD